MDTLMLETKSATATRPRPSDLEDKSIEVTLEIKADSIDDESRTFSGLAATWDLDSGGDVIHQGAFKKTLKEWRKGKRLLPLLDSHNAWGSVRNVIGKIEEAAETDAGLEAKFSVIDGPDGDEIWRRIKAGLITGLSIGYRPVKIEMPTPEEELQGIWRHLKEVKLREVSVVLWPMNDTARIDAGSIKRLSAGIAALEHLASKRELTDEEKSELEQLQDQIGELLKTESVEPGGTPPVEPPPTPEDDSKELTPDDPARLEADRKLTEMRLRRHGTRVDRT